MDEITRKLIYEFRQSWGFEGSDLDDGFSAESEILELLEQEKKGGSPDLPTL